MTVKELREKLPESFNDMTVYVCAEGRERLDEIVVEIENYPGNHSDESHLGLRGAGFVGAEMFENDRPEWNRRVGWPNSRAGTPSALKQLPSGG